MLSACVYESQGKSMPKSAQIHMAENWARWGLRSGEPCVKHKPHGKWALMAGREGEGRPRKRRNMTEGRRRRVCRQLTQGTVRGRRKWRQKDGDEARQAGRMWLPLPWRRPEHAQVSVGIIGKPAEAQKRQKVPEEAARGNPDQDGPGQKLRTFPTVRERRRGEEIWVQGDFRIWRTKLRISAWKTADCVVWVAGRRLSVQRGGCWSLEERCEVTAPGTAEYTVCWASSLACKGNNMVLPHHHPRAEVQEINWQMCSELRLPRHVWCRETPNRRVVKKRTADQKLIKKREVVLFFSVKFTSTKCYIESC